MSADIRHWLEARLQGEGPPLVIDGGMGTELEKNGVPMDELIGSARALLSHPQQVREVHENYIRAGAEAIITNTFSAARHMLEPAGIGDQTAKVNRRAVALALQARDRAATAPVAVVGSICEWVSAENARWNSAEALAVSVREQAELLAGAGVDLIALEMCQTLEHSCACIEAALEVGLPLWLGVCARSHAGRTRLSVFDHPEFDFERLVRRLADYPALAMNVMHTPIADVDAALAVVRRHWPGPVGVYPESGQFKMPNWEFVDIIEPDDLARLGSTWVDDGVRLLGGCCGLGPAHIGALRQAINPIVAAST